MKHNFKDEPDFQLSEKYGKCFDLVNDYIAICSKLETALPEKKLQEKDLSQYDIILLTSAPKMIGSVLSIAKLCDCGLVEDASTLLRKLLEICAYLRHLNQEQNLKVERASRFFWFEAIVKRKRLNRAIQQPEDFGKTLSEEILTNKEQILSDYERAKSVYPLNQDGEIEEEFRKHWAGKPIDKILLECDMERDLSTYIMLSESSHFSYSDIRRYIDFDNSTVRTGVDEKEIPFILIKSLLFAGEVIDLCSREFDLNLTNDLSDLKARIKQRNSELERETGMKAF